MEVATIQLGSKEKPVRVNCGMANHYRWLYVKVNYEQQQLIDALEMQEGDRLLADFNIDRGTNLSLNEVKLRYPSNSRSLAGCYVTLTVKPGPHKRGKRRWTSTPRTSR